MYNLDLIKLQTSHVIATGIIWGLLQLFSSCAKINSLATLEKNGVLAIVSGSGQTMETDQGTSEPLKVILSYEGQPTEGETITYKIISGTSFELVESSATTDSNGHASVNCRRIDSVGDVIISASWKTQTVFFRLSTTASGSSGTHSDAFSGLLDVNVLDGSVTLSWSGSKSDDDAGAKIALYVSAVASPDSLTPAAGSTPVQITGFAHRSATLFELSAAESLPEKTGALKQTMSPSSQVYTILFPLLSSQSYLMQLK